MNVEFRDIRTGILSELAILMNGIVLALITESFVFLFVRYKPVHL